MVERATIDTSAETSGPTPQETYDSLVKEGVIRDENTSTEDAQGEQDTQDSTDQRPEWLPEKFKSADELAKAYAELEKKLGRGESENGGDEGDEGDDDVPDSSEAEVTDETTLDFNAFSQEFAANGELSEDSYAALEAGGIPRDLVDAFIEGQTARQTHYESSVRTLAGGDEAYSDMIEWAKDNLSDDEIDAFDNAVNSFDMRQARFAVQGLAARFNADRAQEPSRQITGKGTTTNGVYESTAQMLQDMSDPRYETDPAFRRKVEEKIARSDVI